MQDNLITAAQSAYAYPLLVKQLLINSASLYGDQEISYRGQMRYTFRDFRGRIGQLASALTALGAGHGTTVAVQGFGNVGSVAAVLLAREGCKIVAISDRFGARSWILPTRHITQRPFPNFAKQSVFRAARTTNSKGAGLDPIHSTFQGFV